MVRPECVHCPFHNINSRNGNGTGCGENVCLLEEIMNENEQFYDEKVLKENEMEQKKTKTQTKSEKVEEKEQESVEKVEISVEEMEEIVEKAKKYDELIALKRIDKAKVIDLVSNLRKECYSNFTISRTQMLTLIDNLLARLRNF